jgi:hypothetical protein
LETTQILFGNAGIRLWFVSETPYGRKAESNTVDADSSFCMPCRNARNASRTFEVQP